MTAVKEAIARMNRLAEAGFPKGPTTQPEIQKQLHKFDQGVGAAEPTEDLLPFLERSRSKGVGHLRRFELNRVLRGAWCNAAFDDFGMEAVDRADGEGKRSADQALIEGYLSYFPYDRPVIGRFAKAARRAADRHAWAWRRRSQNWYLFDPAHGPARVGSAVASAQPGEGSALLSEIGLGRQIASTRFGRAAFVAGCGEIAARRGEKAARAQSGLLRLFDAETQASDLPHLVRALLEPWVSDKPATVHRKALSAFLIGQVGDPRIVPRRWDSVLAGMAQAVGAQRAAAIVQVLKRWLTDVTMREFFAAIAKTTNRPDQWRDRTNFWLAYLDAGLVQDAWPALGRRTRHGIENLAGKSGERPPYGTMRGGPISSSSIIMRIGDLVIAEWSDNGSCRFWSINDPKAPERYGEVYDGLALRTTDGRADFEYHAHVPSPGWEGKFAGVIHRRTGVAHPELGRGWSRNQW
ncbi:MAG TPA: EH signature domain-containing protein [Allosphingosinicella sp.]|jgi:hypothetical protein